jgi:hypothetical protein
MQIPEKLMRYLNDKNVTYEIPHQPEAFTAQTIAAAEHISDPTEFVRLELNL